MNHLEMSVRDRLLNYVQIDTQSDELMASRPTTAKQFDLLRLLEDELRQMGASQIELSTSGYLLATIPATVDHAVPTIAFFAHVDTTPALSGANVKPRVIKMYDGQAIGYPDNDSLALLSGDRPYLATRLGHDIITASGTTLLGADDKAGIAIMMALAETLLHDRSIPHGAVRLCFTTDEEVGYGVDGLDIEAIDADIGYTLDGGEVGELTYETFSADKAIVTIEGVSTHTGTAFGHMVNALTLAAKFVTLLPDSHRTPETTRERAGFLHLYQIDGSAAIASIYFLLRDFSLDGLASHGDLLRTICDTFQQLEPRAKVSLDITPQYRNMRYWLEDDMRPVTMAVQAMQNVGIKPIFRPIRGGTDGSRLTEMGLPTPNLFTGMQDIHSLTEWISVQDMAKSAEMCLELCKLYAHEPLSGE